MSFVYWITDDDTKSPVEYGYVGITSKTVEYRIKQHKRDYKRFCSSVSRKTVGCKKLYATVKNNGGWSFYKVLTLCESSLNYCLELENKLRPEPNVALNTRVGGDYHVMHKRQVSEATKLKLAAVRKTWTMSEETRKRLSAARKSEGNPMYGTEPWNNPATHQLAIKTWLISDRVFEVWSSKNAVGVKVLHKRFADFNYWTIDSMIRKFRTGWNPMFDSKWLTFKEQYETESKERTL